MIEDRKAELRAEIARRERELAKLDALPDRTGLPFSNLYVRKESLTREGKKGFPAKIRVTVEVLD